jgi:CHASE2 domain-containing sensor protein
MTAKKRHIPVKMIRLLIHSVIVLMISYVIVLCFIVTTKSLSFFSVLDESGDVPMSDMYLYVNSKRGLARLDTNITLVSIDLCKDRFEIARLIQQIDSLRPKVIGLDVFFRNRKEPEADALLENVIRQCKNIIVTCILDEEQRENKDIYNHCNHNFFAVSGEQYLTEGFINLDSDGNSTVQTFTPRLYLQKEESLDTLYSFAAQIARFYHETGFQKLLQRPGNLELIRFQPLWFHEINKNEIADNPELITGKTVLIGSLSEDLHKTPINPQMRGIEIHAHIISTIVEEKYIDRLDNFWTKLMNVLLCYLFTLFCWMATTRLRKGVAILIKGVQVGILFLAFFAGYYLFNRYSIDITYTRAIIVMGVVILIVDVYHVCFVWCSKFFLKPKKIHQNEKDS